MHNARVFSLLLQVYAYGSHINQYDVAARAAATRMGLVHTHYSGEKVRLTDKGRRIVEHMLAIANASLE